jgi:hypothetical protein
MTRQQRRIVWPAGTAVAVLVVALAAGCQPLPHPFAEDRPPAALIAVPDNFDVAVSSFEGQPAATAAKLPAAIAHELLKHNIAASDQTVSKGSYKLDGRIEEHPDQPGKSLLTVFWRLRDPRGNIVTQRSDRLTAPTREWHDGNDERVTQLAAAGAAGLAALLTDETPKEQPGGGRTRVAIRKIAGAPGDGNASLASSLRSLLQHQDLELVDAVQGRPELDVDAEIKVDPAKDGQQHVKIVWHVARPGGSEIGQVTQENDVPRGRLDAAWGDIAYSVAMAAEGGIMRLVDRGGAPQRRGVEAAEAATPASLSGAAAVRSPAGPPVAGNLDSPEVNLPPVNVRPSPDTMPMPKPFETPDVPVLLPYRGVPIPH